MDDVADLVVRKLLEHQRRDSLLPDKPTFTAKEVRSIFGITNQTLREWVTLGKLPEVRVSARKSVFKRENLLKLLK